MMTLLRNDPDSISNYYDQLFAGIGHRGSSFTDADRLIQNPPPGPAPLHYVHDGATNRYLLLEFKHSGEQLSNGQRWAIKDFSLKPGCESWIIRKLDNGSHDIVRFCDGKQRTGQLSDKALQNLFAAWWAGVIS